MGEPIYFDNNATTPVAPEVIEAMAPYFSEHWGNPSSMHRLGSKAKRAVDQARRSVAALIGAEDPNEIIFTSCGTESNNLALKGNLSAQSRPVSFITSAVEHSAVLEPLMALNSEGIELHKIPVDPYGTLQQDVLAEQLKNTDTALASIMWANNETGVVFPMAEIAEKVKEAGGIMHTDAVQAAGKIAIDVKTVPVDLLSISGHKLYAPKGIGALYSRRGTRLGALQKGGHQERGRRAGTENVPYIVGLGKACELAMQQMEKDTNHERKLRDRLEAGILATCKGARINGDTLHRLPNTSNISFEYLEGEAIMLMLDDAGICTSTGSACESGSLEPSHVLRAMDVPRAFLQGSIRFSLGRYNTEADVDAVLEKLPLIIKRLRELSPLAAD
ncbi:cysteine desulfurase NifS [Pontiellaceae bacterium B12219]|nr:cysteine desulfurase NifS [Pontiellaceae bacterium B12219]